MISSKNTDMDSSLLTDHLSIWAVRNIAGKWNMRLESLYSGAASAASCLTLIVLEWLMAHSRSSSQQSVWGQWNIYEVGILYLYLFTAKV